jgi:hypothetical protein
MVRGSKHTEETKAKLRAAKAKYRRGAVHGTNDAYVNHSCRCRFCAEARKAYMRYRREETRLIEDAQPV